MSTKITTPELLDFPNDSTSSANTSGTVIPAGSTGIDVDYLVIAGGGGGGRTGGGGGAGGYRNSFGSESSGGNSASETTLNLNVSTPYSIIVGDGGAGGSGSGSYAPSGSDSVFDSITSTGGGGGGDVLGNGNTGGSGGGGGSNSASQTGGAGTTSQGSNGGDNNSSSPYSSGGGGGAGAAGDTAASTGGNGGNGLSSLIDGIATVRAGGGGGGIQGHYGTTPGTGGTGGGGDGAYDAVGANATTNTGSGGGGGGYTPAGGNYNGGAGGSGIIILRVANTITATFSAGVTSTLTQVGGGTWTSGDKIYTITETSSGSETVTFTVVGTIRPTTNLNAGEFRYNEQLGYVEYYDGTNWYQVADEYITGQPTSCLCRYPNNTNVALYTFQDNTNDTCGNYNGTPNNLEPYTASGKYRKAAVFNGTNSYVQISHNFDFSKDFSVSMWINPTTLTAATYYSIFSTDGYGGGGNIGFNIYLYGTALRPWIEISTSYYDPFNTGTVATGVWQHVVLTRAYDDKWELYLDGTSLGTYNSQGITTNFTSTSFNNIGKSGNSSHYFDGSIDQTRIFTSALSQAQVTELYNEIACN